MMLKVIVFVKDILKNLTETNRLYFFEVQSIRIHNEDGRMKDEDEMD